MIKLNGTVNSNIEEKLMAHKKSLAKTAFTNLEHSFHVGLNFILTVDKNEA